MERSCAVHSYPSVRCTFQLTATSTHYIHLNSKPPTTTPTSLCTGKMRFTTTAVISLAALITASTTPSPTVNCVSILSSFKAATPSPTPQTPFVEYMRENDPFARTCLSANVPGISLLERNRFYEDYAAQARWCVSCVHGVVISAFVTDC
jgi:hypothetical protein